MSLGKNENVGSEYATKDVKGMLNKRITKIVLLGLIITVIGSIDVKLDVPYLGLFLTNFFFPFCTTLGTTVIAASIVGFIFADNDYMKLLKQTIVSVIFNPEVYRNQSQLLEIWKKISLKLLETVLPFSKELAVKKIENQFFNDERDYHFEDVECHLKFKVNDDTGIVTIRQDISASLVITPNRENPILKHFISLQESGKLSPISLRLNGDMIKVDDYLTKDETKNNKYIFEYPLKDKIHIDEKRRTVKYRREVQIEQKLSEDPSFSTNITRFVKGYNIEAEINKGYTLKFDRFGINSENDMEPKILPEGKLCWELGKRNDLLLPGEAFILTISKGEKS